jgi:putative flippase GtrA
MHNGLTIKSKKHEAVHKISLMEHYVDLTKKDVEFLRFLLVGIVNTLVGLSIIYMNKWLIGLGDIISNIIGYSVGLTISFNLNSRWTFKYNGNYTTAIAKFLFVFLIAYSVNLITVLFCIKILLINTYLSQAIGVPPYTIIFYLGSKLFAFR